MVGVVIVNLTGRDMYIAECNIDKIKKQTNKQTNEQTLNNNNIN